MKNKITTLFKKPSTYVVLAFIAVLTGWALFGGDEENRYEFTVAERGVVVQSVAVTGRVKPADSVDLGFERAGRISRINARVGDAVRSGALLMQLENAELAARLDAAEVKLREKIAGTREEEIAVERAKVNDAAVALTEAKQALFDALHEAFVFADDAIRNKVDQFFDNPQTQYRDVTFITTEEEMLEARRGTIEITLAEWNTALRALEQDDGLLSFTETTRDYLNDIKDFLNFTALVINGLKPSSDISQTTIDAYKADVLKARTNINTELSDISGAEKGVRTKQTAVAVAERTLELKEAGSTIEEIDAQEAKVDEIRAQLSQTVLRAPINGIISDIDIDVGEIVAANDVVLSLISPAQFTIEANVPEADIAKLELGDTARVTLDAYGSAEFFYARITAIDPAETVIEGVPTYKTTFQFIEDDSRIRSGMTADIDIATAQRENAITIPQRAIFYNGKPHVRVLLDDGSVEEVSVTLGLQGSEGEIEIITGLEGGEKVITFIKE